MKKISFGLEKVLVGEVVAAGGMPGAAALTQLGRTLKGSANFNIEDDSTTEIYCEEEADPIASLTEKRGKATLTFNVLEFDVASLISIFGGTSKTASVTIDGVTKTVEKYVAPRNTMNVEKAVRVITSVQTAIDIPRAKINATFVWNFTKTEVAQIKIVATALMPAGATDGTYEIYEFTDASA
ncbi:MAG: hypothetical protein MdMp024_0926 [Bacteroidales bacterium]